MTSAPQMAWSKPPATYGRERVFAGVAAGTVAAVVAERDGLGERHVEAERTGDRRGDLGDLERVGEAGALVVVGEHEHLCLAGQAAERAGVQDAVAVAFEAGAPRIGRFLDRRGCRRRWPRVASVASDVVFAFLAGVAGEQQVAATAGPRVGVGEVHAAVAVARHGGGPALRSLVHLGHRPQGTGHRPCRRHRR